MAGNGPKYRVKMSRKDGQQITSKNYKNEEITHKYADVGSLWENKFGGLDFKVDRKVTLDPENYFFSAFSTKPRNEDSGEETSTPKKSKAAPAKDPFADE